MTKSLKNIVIEGHFLNLIKNTYGKPIDHIFVDERLNGLSLKVGNEIRNFYLSLN
jgi:hypothetical protein